MPIYDFECDTCKHMFEAFSKYDERDSIECSKCHGKTHLVFTEINGAVTVRGGTPKYSSRGRNWKYFEDLQRGVARDHMEECNDRIKR